MFPVVKNKAGDMSDINNYRSIALSTCMSKIFEAILLGYVTTNAACDTAQFGFKPGHNTTLCTALFKKTVDYYINRGSHVFACFIDISKAFDSVNYWKLFNFLLDDNVDGSIVALLAYWYSNQSAYATWNGCVSGEFHMRNGTRQGSILSPYLFARYLSNLLFEIRNSKFGCNIGGIFCNILAYADDMVILAPSWAALQFLINKLSSILAGIDLSCNSKKSVCMIFNPIRKDKIVLSKFPCFTLNGTALNFVDSFNYLGHCITCNLSDDSDIRREIRNMFFRTNVLIRRFAFCSTSVKVRLFRAFVLCMYGVALWKHYLSANFKALKSCYFKCAKMFFNYKLYDSNTALLLQVGIPSFDTLLFNYRATLMRMCSNTPNVLVQHFRKIGLF